MLDLKTNRTWNFFSLAMAGCFSLLLAGCGGGDATDSKDATGTATSSEKAAIDPCESLLDNALTYAEPRSLGVESKTTSAAIALNDWFKRCGDDGWVDGWGEGRLGLFDEKTTRRVTSDQFSESDSLHFRTSLLLRSYAQSVKGRTDTERTMGMFYSVVRDIAQNDNDLALTPFEIAMTGLGSARDRAWVFVEGLRQLRVDGFIIAPKEKPDAWLVGARVDGEVLLFDLRLGLPVFRISEFTDGILPQKAVSLAELQEDDEVLGGLTVADYEYPAVDADFDNVDVYVVGGPATFSQRFALLDAEIEAVLAEPLADADKNEGLITRVAKVGGWDADAVKVWPYPIQQLDAFSRMTEADQQRLTQLMSPMQARVVRNRVGDQLVFQEAHWELFKGRIDQLGLTGGLDIAMRYQRIRLGRMEAVTQMVDDDGRRIDVKSPQEFVDMHNLATEHAMVWVAVHQYQTGAYEDAADSLYEYRRSYPEDAVWKGHAEYILGLALASEGDLAKAVKYMNLATEVDGPAVAGQRLLHDIWKSRLPADAVAEPEPKKDAGTGESKADDKPDEADEQKKPEVKKPDEEEGDKKDNAA